MEFMYLLFTRMPGESYRRRLSRVFVVLVLRKGKGNCVELDPCVLQRQGKCVELDPCVLQRQGKCVELDPCVLQRQGKVCWPGPLCLARARGNVLNWTLVSCKGKGNWTLVSCKGKGKCVELDPCVLQRQGEMCWTGPLWKAVGRTGRSCMGV